MKVQGKTTTVVSGVTKKEEFYGWNGQWLVVLDSISDGVGDWKIK